MALTPTKYQPKQETIYAVQLTADNVLEVALILGQRVLAINQSWASDHKLRFIDGSKSFAASLTDFIIMFPDKSYGVLRADDFNARYEEASA